MQQTTAPPPTDVNNTTVPAHKSRRIRGIGLAEARGAEIRNSVRLMVGRVWLIVMDVTACKIGDISK